jgi:hypothetical protein
MAISFAAATQTLLNGKTLAWGKFGEHKGGSVNLGFSGQRRLFAFLLAQDPTKVAQGHEDLFSGLIVAWKKEDSDPASEDVVPALTVGCDVWRLDRIEASGYGGLTIFGGAQFDFWINGENWCLEGQNGSGKTSLVSAILWALTGKRIREQDGPIDEQGVRLPVTNNEGKKIGDWPSFASYPASAADLVKSVEVWVRLTFKNANGEFATAYRRMICPLTGDPISEATVDPRLQVATELIETGLLMPARIAKVGFGDRSQSLYEGVKMLTGLDQFADIAEGCGQFTHAGRKFLRYGKDNGIEGLSAKFDENMGKAQLKAKELNFTLPEKSALNDKNVVQDLKDSAASASAEAGTHLATLKSEIAPDINTAASEGRLQVRNAVSAARAITNQGAKGIAVFDAWTALKEANEHQPFAGLPAQIETVRSKLDRALAWHIRQVADTRFRLKALAAKSFVPPHKHSDTSECPLCASALLSEEQRALAAELAELQNDAEEAERKIDDVCRSLETELLQHLPAGLKLHREVLSAMDPRESYASAVLQRFSGEPPFSDILIGLAGRLKAVVLQQKAVLPSFSFPEFNYARSEPSSAVDLRRNIHSIERLIALVNWWSKNRALFRDSWSAIIGQKQAGDAYPPNSIEGELRTLEQALAKADPLDELSKFLLAAAGAAESWAVIRKEQDLREAIAKAVEPLKELRVLVGAETARSIATLSGRIRDILGRIHLHERLVYEQASLGKKTVNVAGGFEQGMQIDAALVANTSWLRAILWAFVLALREETIETLGANPFPLMVLDDPQTTFDPRNKRKWAQEIARLANMDRVAKQGIQLLLTTHERQFFQCLVDHEKLTGERGLIGGVNKACGVATIVNGGCLERAWREASDNNDDARARDYIADVRIYCEDLLKFALRGEGPSIPGMSLDSLKNELKRLHDAHVAPFDRKAFTDLRNTLSGGGGGKAMKLINESHHKDDESIGLAEAKDVKEFWAQKLMGQIHDAFGVYDNFESFYGEPRTFPWAKNVIAFPAGFKEEVKALKFQQTGIAAAAKSDGHAGDGVVTVEEWKAGTPIILPNHEVYQLAAGTLDPVAGIGDILIVCNHAKVNPRNLVVAVFGESLLARRYNLIDAHPEIIVLTGQSVDPLTLPEPIIVPADAQIRKVVGTVFAARTLPPPAMDANREFVPLADANVLTKILDGARLFQVKGRSAEPIALEGQFLITREATKTLEEVKALDGCPIVAIDEEGTRFFKRLRCSGQLAVLESLNPDGTTASELLSFDGALGLPKLTHALEVIGVLFELPQS